MSALAIRAEGLGKAYGLIHKRSATLATYNMLVDDLMGLPRRLAAFLFGGVDRELFWALKDVSFEVATGEIVGIIGRNGAGKSTLLKVLARITDPSEGQAKIYGRVGSLLEIGTGFHGELTGRENVFLSGAILGMKRAEIARKFEAIVDFAEIEQFLDTPVKHFSSGMYTRLAFAVAAHLEPEILVVDEVLAVGDLQFQKKCLGKMGEVAEAGRTILLVSHQMETITRLCHSVILLKNGRLDSRGEPSDVVGRYLAQQREHSQTSLRERHDRTGDGRLRFVATWTENSLGDRNVPVLSGEPLTIAAEYELREGVELSSINVAFPLFDRNFYQLTQLSNQTTGDVFTGPLPNHGVVRCTLSRVALNRGEYSYHAIARSGGLAIEDAVPTAGYFQVEAGDFFRSGKALEHNQGPVLVDQRWRLDEA